MKALRIHIQRMYSLDKEKRYVTCIVDVPGLGEIELKDVIPLEVQDSLFSIVEEAAKMKLGLITENKKEVKNARKNMPKLQNKGNSTRK